MVRIPSGVGAARPHPNPRNIAIIMLCLIALIVIMVIIVILPIGTGTMVTVDGHIQNDWGGANYEIHYDSHQQDVDYNLLGMNPLWFWESESMIVEVEIGDKIARESIGKVGRLLPGTHPFEGITIRHVPPGEYTAVMRLFQMEGGIFGFGGDEVQEHYTTFSITVEDYGNNDGLNWFE